MKVKIYKIICDYIIKKHNIILSPTDIKYIENVILEDYKKELLEKIKKI